ncbi:MAG: type II secretion system F family protein [Planctomycetota bacterium]
MATFEDIGVDASGQNVKGVIEAVDRKAAIADLSVRGQFASKLTETGDAVEAGANEGFSFSFGGSRINDKKILEMTSQLATALKAGLPILNALEILKSQQKNERMGELLDELSVAVSSGQSMSEAMAKHPDIFSALYVSMVRVGETGGILDKTMQQLVNLMSREIKIRSNLIGALIYPFFILTVGLISMIVILIWVLPKIINTIGMEPSMLPLPTKMLMGLSQFLLSFGWLVAIGLVLGVYAFVKWKKSPQGRVSWDSFKLKLPLFGNVLRTLSVGRFARTLGALTSSGITILEALQVVRDTLGNEVLALQIDDVAGKVKTGSNLADPLEESGMFPALLVQIVAMGEQTGCLDELLLNAAETFDEQADTVVSRFMTLFPSLLILGLALVIAFIIMATLLPILTMDLSIF